MDRMVYPEHPVSKVCQAPADWMVKQEKAKVHAVARAELEVRVPFPEAMPEELVALAVNGADLRFRKFAHRSSIYANGS